MKVGQALVEVSVVSYTCALCGYESLKWMGKCPVCGEWNSLKTAGGSESLKVRGARGRSNFTDFTSIKELQFNETSRIPTGFSDVDKAFGGGVVPGSISLIAGEPGIGKSTLLLQIANFVAKSRGPVVYVSGEESGEQIKGRAQRTGCLHERLLVTQQTEAVSVVDSIRDKLPVMVIVDSIQTMSRAEVPGPPGSIAQMREVAGLFTRLSKDTGIAVIVVGHVSKEGAIAGPKLVEHMVDVVLYFEGDAYQDIRILRVRKNRFGPTNEIALFEMDMSGLREILDPSAMLTSQRPHGIAGSVIVPAVQGSRPLLIEVQALTGAANYGTPRRVATGVDHNRLAMIAAVLDKRLNLKLNDRDAYVKVVGGLRVDEPAIDLGIALALVSSYKNVPLKPGLAVLGEVGLAGEIRGVSRVEQRVQEAGRVGYKTVIVPSWNQHCSRAGTKVIGVCNLEEAVAAALV